MQNSFHNTGPTSFACELQFSMVLSWVDDVSDGNDASTRGVSEHLLNRDRQTVTEADAEQTARKCKTPSTTRDSLPLHASCNSQWFLHESMIVSDESDANTCGVRKHLWTAIEKPCLQQMLGKLLCRGHGVELRLKVEQKRL